MLYLVAVVLPPLAVLLCGKPVQALLSIVLSLFLYFPGLIHALFVVNKHYADKRHQEILREMRRGGWAHAGGRIGKRGRGLPRPYPRRRFQPPETVHPTDTAGG